MVAKKSTRKRQPKKLGLKKEILKDLDAGSKGKAIKGGSIVNCATRVTR
jgi:hypothetical protein